MNRADRERVIVREYCFSSRTAGMMFNSNTLRSERIFRQNRAPMLYVRSKPAFGEETTTLYHMPEALFAKLQTVVDSADVFALSELKKNPAPFGMCDASGSADCSLTVDRCTDAECVKNISVRLDPAALRMNGCGAFLDEINSIIEETAVPENVTDLSEAEWKCAQCGHTETKDVRFCPACGCPKY